MKARWISISVTALIIISIEQALADDTLVKKSGCLECHSIEKKVVGPAFHDIATRYKGDTHARETLIGTVRNGGKGNWTDVSHGVPMPPYSGRLSDAEIEHLVDWVLGL
jgi:cytochrome c